MQMVARLGESLEACSDVNAIAKDVDSALRLRLGQRLAVERDLAPDDDPMTTTAQRHLGRGRRSRARRPDDLRCGQILDGPPSLVGLADAFLGAFAPYL